MTCVFSIGRLIVTAGLPAIVALSPAACGKPRPAPATPSAVATVNGVAVTAEEFALEWNIVRGTAMGIAPIGESSARALKRDLLDRIIERRLALAALAGTSPVAAEEIKQEIAEMRSGYSDDQFNEAMVGGLMTQETLERRVRERLAADRFLQTEVFKDLAVLDGEVDAYFTEHAREFDRPERVRVQHIVVKTEEEIAGIRERLKAGEDFSDLARRFSTGVEAKNGGELRPYAKGEMPQVFDAAFEMAAGQVSGPIASPYGFHLLKVVQRIPAARASAAEAAPEVRLKILEQKKRAAKDAWLARAKSGASITVNREALDAIP